MLLSLRIPLLSLLLGVSLTGTATAAPAVPQPAQLERWLRQSVKLPNGQRLRVEIEVGTLGRGLSSPRAREPNRSCRARRSSGGRANVGLRCIDGARWHDLDRARVSAYGPALVARTALPAGRIPQPADFTVQEVDWAESRSAPIANPALLHEQESIRPVAAGQPLLTEYLRLTPSVRAGQPVAVVVDGPGFTIGIDAVALSTAAEGQQVRARTGTGKVLNGTVDGKSAQNFPSSGLKLSVHPPILGCRRPVRRVRGAF